MGFRVRMVIEQWLFLLLLLLLVVVVVVVIRARRQGSGLHCSH
jgi:hypothetical protein